MMVLEPHEWSRRSARTQTIKPDDLHEIAATTTKDKQMAGKWILLQGILGQHFCNKIGHERINGQPNIVAQCLVAKGSCSRGEHRDRSLGGESGRVSVERTLLHPLEANTVDVLEQNPGLSLAPGAHRGID